MDPLMAWAPSKRKSEFRPLDEGPDQLHPVAVAVAHSKAAMGNRANLADLRVTKGVITRVIKNPPPRAR